MSIYENLELVFCDGRVVDPDNNWGEFSEAFDTSSPSSIETRALGVIVGRMIVSSRVEQNPDSFDRAVDRFATEAHPPIDGEALKTFAQAARVVYMNNVLEGISR